MSKNTETSEKKATRKKVEKTDPETKGRYVGLLILIFSILASLVFYFLQ